MKHINLEKLKNPLYSKIRTNLVLDVKKVSKVSHIKKDKHIADTNNNVIIKLT